MDQVRILNRQITPARHSSQEFFDLFNGGGLDMAPLRNATSSPAARTQMARDSVIVRHSLIQIGQGGVTLVKGRDSATAARLR
jgi:hypothetical protein